MEKKVTILVICALLLGSIFVSAGFASPFGSFENLPVVRVLVDNRDLQGDVPGVIFQGRTLVPLRFVAEAMGAEVEWDEEIYTVSITTVEDPEFVEIKNEGWQTLANAEDAYKINEFYGTWNGFFKSLSTTWVKVINLNTNTYFVEEAHHEVFKKYTAENLFEATELLLEELELLRENAVNKYTDDLPGWRQDATKVKNSHALYSYMSMAIINNLWESYYLTQEAFSIYEADHDQYSDLHEKSRLMVQELEDNILTLKQETALNELSWKLILENIFSQNLYKNINDEDA